MEEIPAYLPQEDYDQLVEIFNRELAHKSGKILVFGSRAVGNHKAESDLDLVLSLDKFSRNQETLSAIQKAIEQSRVSVPVEIFDYNEVTSGTLQRIQREGQVFWQNDKDQKVQ